MRFRCRIVLAIACVAACSARASAEWLKVDISTVGQSKGWAPGFTQWIPPAINCGSAQTTTISGLTFTLALTSPAGDATHYLKCQYANKDGQTYGFQLSYDGIWPHWKDDSIPADMPYPDGGALTLTIDGLSAGPHPIVTYHNCPWPATKTWTVGGTTYTSAVSDCHVSVDGVHATTITPTIDNRNDATCGYAFFTVQAVADTPVVISFTPAHNRSLDNVFLNGFEIDAPGAPSALATLPVPADGDLHVDTGNDDPNAGAAANGRATLSWTPSAFAVSHDVYFGTSRDDVSNATTATATIFQGNQTATSYPLTGLAASQICYWRIDEIDATGATTRGAVWSFAPRRVAFPGAEGWGRFARGGRGGRVLHVTNLNDAGPGSLRATVEDTGPRTIVFDVSGTIALKSSLYLKNPHCTVAGQTAPGKGICLRDYDFGTYGGSDFIIRYMRVRVGKEVGTDKTLGGMGTASSTEVILDHCSISWAQDEQFSSRSAGNLTLQRTLISEALHVAGHNNYPPGKSHGFAASIGGDVGSFHHNLLAHCEGRNWSLAGGLDPSGHHTGRLDIRNNVVYNWDGRTTDGGAQHVNFVGNYYRPGPATHERHELNPDLAGIEAFGPQLYYVEGNVMEGVHGPEGPEGPFQGVDPGVDQPGTQYTRTTPFFESYVATQSAAAARENVLADVGCNRPMLDDHDTRIIDETRHGTFTYRGSTTNRPGLPDNQADVGGWEDYPEIHRPADFDTDYDGLPDGWEVRYGLNPHSAAGDDADANGDLDDDGYTNLESYLNDLARGGSPLPDGASAPTMLERWVAFTKLEWSQLVWLRHK